MLLWGLDCAGFGTAWLFAEGFEEVEFCGEAFGVPARVSGDEDWGVEVVVGG